MPKTKTQKAAIVLAVLLITTAVSYVVSNRDQFASSLLSQADIEKSTKVDWSQNTASSGSLILEKEAVMQQSWNTLILNKISSFTPEQKNGLQEVLKSILFQNNTPFSVNHSSSSNNGSTILGKTSSGQSIGMLFNNTDSPQTYTLINSPKEVKSVLLTKRTQTGALLEEKILSATNSGALISASSSMLATPFEWGVNGHPLGTYPYLDISIDEQLQKVRDLGMDWYRFDYAGGGRPGCDANCLVRELIQKRGNLKLSIPIFPNDLVFQGNKIRLKDGIVVYRRDDGVIIKEDGTPYTGSENINEGTALTKPDGTAVYAYSREQVKANAAWYGEAIASSYKSQVAVWEMNNELNAFTFARTLSLTNWKNLPPEQHDPTKIWNDLVTGISQDYNSALYNEERYQRVLAQLSGLSEGIRKGDPSARIAISSAGVSPSFFEKLIGDGVDFDIIQYHNYGNKDSTDLEKEIIIDGLKRASKFGKEIYIGEGNRAHGSYTASGNEQEEYLKEILPFIQKFYPLVRGYFFYELLDEPYAAVPWEKEYGLYTVKKDQNEKFVIDQKKAFLPAVENVMKELHQHSISNIPALVSEISSLPELAVQVHTANSENMISITLPANSTAVVSDTSLLINHVQLLKNSYQYFDYLLQTYPELQTYLLPKTLTASFTPELEKVTVVSNTNTITTNTPLPSQPDVSLPPIQTITPAPTQIFNNSSGASYYRAPSTTNTTPLPSPLKASAPKEIPFKDIKGHFAESAIISLFEKGIITGQTPVLFNPNAQLNRAEAATLITKAYFKEKNPQEFLNSFRKQHPAYTYLFFKDVLLQSWFAPYVGIIKEEGIIRGTSPTHYEPVRSITRAEYLKIVLEARKKFIEASTIPSNLPRDVKPTDWFAPYVSQGFHQGIIDQKLFFEPNRFITRAEAVKILSIALNK
ncbi:MAG: S-layer homology domain-containing protein [Candidatus Gracilibacteria bacterium]